MSNDVHNSIHAVNIRSNPNRFLLNPRIDFRNRLDRRIHALRVPVNLRHEISERLNSEIDPLPKIRVRKISQLQIFLRIKPSLFLESSHGVIVKASPGVFPSIEVRHPVRDVHINPINPRTCNLPDVFHINLPPIRRIRTNPDILIPLANPESRPASKQRRLPLDVPLHPVRVFLEQRMRSLIRISRYALRPRDINVSVIANRMRLLSHGVNSLQLLLGINKTFIPPLNVVVDLNPKHAIFLRVLDDPLRIVAPQPISPNAHIVSPILVLALPVLFCRIRTSQQHARKKHQSNERGPQDGRPNQKPQSSPLDFRILSYHCAP